MAANLGKITRDEAEAMANSYEGASPGVKELMTKMGGIGSSVAVQYDVLANAYTWDSSVTPGTTFGGMWKVDYSTANGGGENIDIAALQKVADAANKARKMTEKQLVANRKVAEIFSDLKEYVRNEDRGWEMSERLEQFFASIRQVALQT